MLYLTHLSHGDHQLLHMASSFIRDLQWMLNMQSKLGLSFKVDLRQLKKMKRTVNIYHPIQHKH